VTGVTYRDAPHNAGTSRDGTGRRSREVCHEPSRTGPTLCSEFRKRRKEMRVCRNEAST
jgi:hypothetical protein